MDRFFDFSLLGLLASGFLAVAGSGYLDLPSAIITVAALVLRGFVAAGWIKLEISSRKVAAATLLYLGFYPLDYLYVSRGFLQATVHLILFLAIVKVLTATSNRDYFFVKVIALLEVLAAAMLSSNLSFFVFLILFIMFGVSTFAASEIRRSAQAPHRMARSSNRRFHWYLAGLSVSAAFGILLMTAGLFFLLPRTARAAFRHLIPERYHVTGFSNQIDLDRTGDLQLSDSPVMHIHIEDVNHGLMLKWRGAAMIRFDGRRWYNPTLPKQRIPIDQGQLSLADLPQRWRQGARISYEVVLQSIDSDALFFAGIPEYVRIALPAVYRMPTDAYRTGMGTGDGIRYFALSYIPQEGIGGGPYDPAPLDEDMRRAYLELPPTDPRIAALTRRLTANAATDFDAARGIETYLRSNFGYTTQLPSESVADPVAHFLFERRKGHCEYFASAMAVMLREMGIPTRVVNGFQGGTYNPLTGWHVIRGADAHSWVEAYLRGRGWTTFDPTPPDPRPARAGIWSRLSLLSDAADTFWREWVLNYDREHQFDLATRLDSSRRVWSFEWWSALDRRVRSAGAATADIFRRYSLILFIAVVALAGGVFAANPILKWLAGRRHSRRLARGDIQPHDATLLYNRMLETLHKRGYEKPPWLTPAEFARVLPSSSDGPLVADITAAYNELRYGGRADAAHTILDLLGKLETASH